MKPDDYRERTGVPRWLKLTVLIGVLVAAVIVVVVLMGGGGGHNRPPHGPGGGGGTVPASGVVVPDGHVPPSHPRPGSED